MSTVQIYIEFTGRRLDVFKTEDGRDVTPLKPIVELFGVNWVRQRKKFQERPAFARNLGVCRVQVVAADGQKREQLCIEVDGVAPYLITLNSDLIRANGNSVAADFLEAKFLEWKKVLAEYHRHGSVGLSREDRREAMLIKRSQVGARLITLYDRMKEPRMKLLIDQFIGDLAKSLGYAYESAVPKPKAEEQLDLFASDDAELPDIKGQIDSAIQSNKDPKE